MIEYKGEQAILSIARDISDRKKAERELRLSEEKYHRIFESTGSATLIVDKDTTIVLANKECIEVTGYKAEELIGKKWTQFVAPESLTEMIKYHKLRRENPELAPKKYEVKLINRNGEIRNAVLDIEMMPDVSQSIVAILDITDRINAENELKKSEEKYRNLFNNSEIGMFRTRLDGSEILEFNRKFLTILKYEPEDILGKPSINTWFDKGQRAYMVEQLIKNGKVADLECDLLTKNGEIVNCITSLKLYPDTGILEGSDNGHYRKEKSRKNFTQKSTQAR